MSVDLSIYPLSVEIYGSLRRSLKVSRLSHLLSCCFKFLVLWNFQILFSPKDDSQQAIFYNLQEEVQARIIPESLIKRDENILKKFEHEIFYSL